MYPNGLQLPVTNGHVYTDLQRNIFALDVIQKNEIQHRRNMSVIDNVGRDLKNMALYSGLQNVDNTIVDFKIDTILKKFVHEKCSNSQYLEYKKFLNREVDMPKYNKIEMPKYNIEIPNYLVSDFGRLEISKEPIQSLLEISKEPIQSIPSRIKKMFEIKKPVIQIPESVLVSPVKRMRSSGKYSLTTQIEILNCVHGGEGLRAIHRRTGIARNTLKSWIDNEKQLREFASRLKNTMVQRNEHSSNPQPVTINVETVVNIDDNSVKTVINLDDVNIEKVESNYTGIPIDKSLRAQYPILYPEQSKKQTDDAITIDDEDEQKIVYL
jgi:hypothetical protein